MIIHLYSTDYGGALCSGDYNVLATLSTFDNNVSQPGNEACPRCVEKRPLAELADCDLGGTTSHHCYWCQVPTEKVNCGLYMCDSCASHYL